MTSIGLLLLCIPTLFAVFWAHWRLREHARNTRVVTGLVLWIIGAGFGWVMATVYTQGQGLNQLLIFISSLGLAHVPAAFILQLKHWQHRSGD